MGPLGRVGGAGVRGRCRHPLRGWGGVEGVAPPPPIRAVRLLRVPLAACLRRAFPPVAGRLPMLGGSGLMS